MTLRRNAIDRIRIATPCPSNWETMSGTDEVRFCDQCELHVYDISRMTRSEAASLVAKTDGQICARLFRRPDGKILTKDCPVGLRAIRRRVARAAAATFTALASLSASALGFASTRTSKAAAGDQLVTITRTFVGSKPQSGPATLQGIITDPQGEPVSDAKATLVNERTKAERSVVSNRKGRFKFGLMDPGSYTLKIESVGFSDFVRKNVSLHSNEELRFDVNLLIPGFVGIIVLEELPRTGFVVDGVRVKIN